MTRRSAVSAAMLVSVSICIAPEYTNDCSIVKVKEYK